ALADLGDEKWRNLPIWTSLKALLDTEAEFTPIEIECDLPLVGTRTLLCDARRLSCNVNASLVLVLQDVTERKRADDVIRKNERRFHGMLDALPAAVYTTDAQGCLTYFNATAVALSGREPVLGTDHWCVTWKLFRPDGTPLPKDECPMAIALQGHHPIRGAEVIAERPDGTRVWIEPFPSPIFDGAGNLVGGINMLVDITERKRAEEVLRRQHEQFRSLIDNVPLGVYLIDQDFRIQQVNPVAMPVFASIPDLIGQDFGDVIHVLWHKDYADEIVRRFRHTLETGEPYSAPERTEQRRDLGVTEYYEWRIERIPLPDGNHGVVCYFRDISAIVNARVEREMLLESERAARMEADKAARLKDDFLAVLSHELRSPLNAILGWTHILKRGTVDPAHILQSAEVIERNAKLQSQVISDLLDMSRINAGKLRLVAEKVDIREIVVAAVDSIRPAAYAKGLALALQVEDTKGFVLGDSSRLEQVFANLLSNAIKFTPRGGSLSISLVARAADVEIRVTDTGDGIEAEFLPFLFDRFRQADLSTARTHGGLGLGLALVKQLTELHGGTVEATSAGKDKGATFVVRLPLAVDRSQKGVRPEFAAMQGTEYDALELDGICVLVVDDDADSLEVVRRVLIERKAEVVSAAGAAEALVCLDRKKVDVILSDIGMPVMDGYSLMREVRRRGIKTPAAALTAFGRPEDRETALRAGYQAYLSKPIDISQMLMAVAALGRRVSGADSPVSA
ncbi:MAG: ATP-binding protein, partial [Planctomycetota bacterium]